MFSRKSKAAADVAKEEIIFDCPACEEQLIVQIPTKKIVVIQCAECGARCSVKQARTGKKAWDQVRKEAAPAPEPPKVVVEEIVPELGKKDDTDIVRAASLKPGGKAALERARAARARTSQRGSNGDATVTNTVPLGPVRTSSRGLANKPAPYIKQPSRSGSTGVTPMMSSATVTDGSAFPSLDDENQ